MIKGARAFVFASGRALRWGGAFKQLCEVDGEPIILRMVKAIGEVVPVTVVTPHAPIVQVLRDNLTDEFIAHWLDILDMGSPPLLTETLRNTARVWDKTNIALLGDCWYSDRALRTIVDNIEAGELKFYGRREMSGLTLNGPEIFAWQWPLTDMERMIQSIDGAKKQFEDSKRQPYDKKGWPHGSAWQLYRGMFGIPLEEHIFDADVNVQKATSAWVEINDFTDDFDMEEKFKYWKEQYARRLFCEKPIEKPGKPGDWEMRL
jgi:hypothetical protein